MKITKYILPILVFSFCLFAKESNNRIAPQIESTSNVIVDPVDVEHSNTQTTQTREEIDLWVDDFEGDLGAIKSALVPAMDLVTRSIAA